MPVPRSHPPAALTRRDFIWRVAQCGGSAMAAMFALDLLARDPGGLLRLDGRAPTKKNRVIVLGAGVAGLCVAHELGKLGYNCTVLEARERPGGRCWTVRGGTTETEIGRAPQTCKFDDGLYMNAGPMRISHHHETTLAYCREFGVALTTFTNENSGAYVHRAGQGKMRIREIQSDWRGYTAELLAKAINQKALDLPLSADDREKMLEYLRQEGHLNAALRYPRGDDKAEASLHASGSRGYDPLPGAVGEPGQPTNPLDLEALLKSGFGAFGSPESSFDQQATMLTPVGGMDRIPYAMADRLGPVVHYRSPVREIRRTGSGGVRVVYTDLAAGADATREVAGDFCVCTMPPGLLARLPADFSPTAAATLASIKPSAAGKIGLQFRRRFWEEDDDIYGGISHTDLPIRQIVYPPVGFGSKKGVVLGYYHFGTGKTEFDDQTFAERERRALEQGAQIHPQFATEFENSFSVGWGYVPHNESAWAAWDSAAHFENCHKVLGEADGPFYFAGDWLSYINAWQAGSFASAQKVCRDLHRRALA